MPRSSSATQTQTQNTFQNTRRYHRSRSRHGRLRRHPCYSLARSMTCCARCHRRRAPSLVRVRCHLSMCRRRGVYPSDVQVSCTRYSDESYYPRTDSCYLLALLFDESYYPRTGSAGCCLLPQWATSCSTYMQVPSCRRGAVSRTVSATRFGKQDVN